MPVYFGMYLLQQMTLAAIFSWWLAPLVSKRVKSNFSPDNVKQLLAQLQAQRRPGLSFRMRYTSALDRTAQPADRATAPELGSLQRSTRRSNPASEPGHAALSLNASQPASALRNVDARSASDRGTGWRSAHGDFRQGPARLRQLLGVCQLAPCRRQQSRHMVGRYKLVDGCEQNSAARS